MSRILVALVLLLILGIAIYCGAEGISVLILVIYFAVNIEYLLMAFREYGKLAVASAGLITFAFNFWFLKQNNSDVVFITFFSFFVLLCYNPWLANFIKVTKLKTSRAEFLPRAIAFINRLIIAQFYFTIFISLMYSASERLIPLFFLIPLVVVVTTDIFAYYGGRTFQGPKLAPSISPGKTISGAICGFLMGGIIVPIIIEKVYGISGHIFAKENLELFVIVTACVSLAGIYGDLFESYLKRQFGVKDSSRILLSHGGVLDRVDALIFGYLTFSVFSVLMVFP